MEVYRHPRTMEPLLPTERSGHLAELTCAITKADGRLTGQVHSPVVLTKVADLVRQMNCYYSNLIEGHKTTPREIERAIQRDFSHNPTERDNQHLSLAHIAVERLMEERLADETVDVYSPGFLCWLHQEFYSRLPDSLHRAKTKGGDTYQVEPGRLRDFMVDVGRHTPPHFEALPQFMNRFHAFYGDKQILETNRLVTIAAAHHRLAWIHPFGDGNGRVIRLHSHALLIRHGIAGHGLWTLTGQVRSEPGSSRRSCLRCRRFGAGLMWKATFPVNRSRLKNVRTCSSPRRKRSTMSSNIPARLRR